MYSSTSGILKSAMTGEVALELSYHEVSGRRTVTESGMIEMEPAYVLAGARFDDYAVLLSSN